MNWSVQNENLILHGRKLAVPGPVQKAVEQDGVLVVLVQFDRIPPGVGDGNVFGFDSVTGTQKWQILAQPNPGNRPNPVTGIWQKNGKVCLYFGGGVDGFVDVETGEVTIPPGQRPW